MENEKTKSTGCCEPFNPEPWEDKKLEWKDKLFVKDHVTSFLHIPLNMGAKIIRNMKLIEIANAKADEQLMLTDEKSLWGADIYISVKNQVATANMVSMSGLFLSKVFEGPYRNVGKWATEMQEYAKSKEETIKKIYFSYTTCPRCAKSYGKNYVVLLAEVEPK